MEKEVQLRSLITRSVSRNSIFEIIKCQKANIRCDATLNLYNQQDFNGQKKVRLMREKPFCIYRKSEDGGMVTSESK